MAAKPLYEVAQIIQNNWHTILQDARFNSHQKRMLNALRVCRTSALGWHLDECNECSHLRISYNSCRNRHCPKCQGKHTETWIRAQQAKLLPVKYFHVVFTIPDILNKLCLDQAKMMYSILFKASWETVKTFSKNSKHLGGQSGMTSILHTWGQNLSLHPHVHCIIPAGGVTANGKWKQVKSKGKFLFPVKAMSKVFRAKFVHLLRNELKNNSLDIGQYIFDRLFKKEWIVFAKRPFLGAEQIIEYIGRYTHKIAISNHRIVKTCDHKVFFRYKDYREDGKSKVMALNEMEFIRRFCLHILPLRYVRIRHFGIMNARSKYNIPDIIQAIQQSNGKLESDYPSSPFLTTKTNTGVKCPRCKKGEMIVVAIGHGRSPPPDIEAIRNTYSTEN